MKDKLPSFDYVNCAGQYFTIGLLVGSAFMAFAFMMSGACGG